MFRVVSQNITKRVVCRSSMRYYCADNSKKSLIEDKLRKEFEPSSLLVVDHSGGCPGGTLEVEIHSPKFLSKSELQRHRMVNKLLKEEISTFHAFVLRTFPSDKE